MTRTPFTHRLHAHPVLFVAFALLLSGHAALATSCTVDHRPLNEAELAEQREDTGRALKLYRELARTDPSNSRWPARVIDMELEQDHIDPSWDEAQLLLARSPGDADALHVFAEVSLRRGDFPLALSMTQRALSADPCNARVIAFLGRLQGMQGYLALQSHATDLAHRLAPLDFVVQQAWAETRPAAEREAALSSLLTFPSLTESQKRRLQWQAEGAALTASSTCSVVPAPEPVVLPLYALDLTHVYATEAPGLAVSLNGHSVDLELGDAGDARILLTRALADSLHLPHDTPNYRPDFTDAAQEYYTHLDLLRVGQLEYRNCPAVVIDEPTVVNQHGTIAVSFFKDFTIQLDFAKRQLRLDSLPEPEGPPVATWSKAAIGGPEVRSRIAGNWFAGAPAIPREKRDWMHAYIQGGSVSVPVAIGPDTERLFSLEYMSGPSQVLPSTARAATLVAKDTSLSPAARAALKSARYSLRTGEVILPVDTWNELPGLYAAGTLGDVMREMRVTLDFRDDLVKIQHSVR